MPIFQLLSCELFKGFVACFFSDFTLLLFLDQCCFHLSVLLNNIFEPKKNTGKQIINRLSNLQLDCILYHLVCIMTHHLTGHYFVHRTLT